MALLGGSVNRAGNRLHNAAFAIDQRKIASNANDTYCFDRWYVLTQSNAIAVSALTDPEDGRPTGIRLTQSHATPQWIGLAQIVESADIRDLRQRMVAMAARLRCSSAQAIRIAILEWNGAADAVVSDVVNAWTNATFTAGQFFKSTSTAVIATGAITPSAAQWTPFGDLHGVLGAACTNVIVMIWSEGTLAQNATLDLDEVQLEPGASCGAFVRRPMSVERQICQRFFELHPGAKEGGFAGQSVRVGTNIVDLPVVFRTAKRAAPTLVHSSPTWSTSTPTTGNDIANAEVVTSTFTTISGGLTPSLVLPNTRIAVLRLTAATSFGGAAGAFGNLLVGSGVLLGYSADL